jgi:hypothetical protein
VASFRLGTLAKGVPYCAGVESVIVVTGGIEGKDDPSLLQLNSEKNTGNSRKRRFILVLIIIN